jgi:hypothetical protein
MASAVRVRTAKEAVERVQEAERVQPGREKRGKLS